MKASNLIGKKFGLWTVVSRSSNDGNGKTRWECKCSCGSIKVVIGSNLSRGKSLNCGCVKSENIGRISTTHGNTKNRKKTLTYSTWVSLKERCYYPDHPSYKWYGERGIKVCDRWIDSFENFLEDMGERKFGLTIDRINPNGDYEPNNCRWATDTQQAQNRRPREH